MSQARIFSSDCPAEVRPVNLTRGQRINTENNCWPLLKLKISRERKVMHTKKIISHLEWKMNEAASANNTDLVSREDLGNQTYVMSILPEKLENIEFKIQ